MNPAVLLLDESLAALDLKLRKAMQEELRQLHRTVGGTFIFVTHDQSEAMGLATRIAVMREGRIVQQGTPKEIYEHPANEFVADFIGEANMIRTTRRSNRILLNGTSLIDNCYGPDGDVVVIVRPDAIDIVGSGEKPDIALPGTVIDRVYLGAYVSVTVRLLIGLEVTLHRAQVDDDTVPNIGEAVTLGWTRDRCSIVAAG
jgi:ABC-type Fe3+/spermidine/putrescine transport system ATPase subunit